VQLIDNWTGHAPTTNTGASIALTAGQKYDIRMEYFEWSGGAVAKLMWAYPNQDQPVVIPQIRLYPAAGGRLAATGAEEFDATVNLQVFPVPAREEIRVRYYAQADGEVTLQLINAAAYSVMLKNHPVIQGENLIRIPVSELSRGMYIITLTQNHQRLSRKVLLAE
jgi:PA14 domain/Secretion system C-terminal sorting domain